MFTSHPTLSMLLIYFNIGERLFKGDAVTEQSYA